MWFATLVTRAYVHNIYLTFNVIVNLLALVRGIYICLVVCLLPAAADAPRPTTYDAMAMVETGARPRPHGGSSLSDDTSNNT